MADNLAVTPGTGATVGADLISTVLYQRVKLIYGDDGVNSGDVSTTNPFPCNVNQVGGVSFALGQQLAAASIPVVLTAAQLTSLTAPVVAAPIPLFVAPLAGFARPADTTAYTFGDLVANNTTAGSVVLDTAQVAKANDQAFQILRCRLQKSTTTLTNAIFRVHLFNVAAPTFTNGDNGAWLTTLASGGVNAYLGSMDVTVDKAGSDVAVGVGNPNIGPAIIGTPISGTKNVAYCLEARAAYTPGNAETFKVYFEVL